jgi:hypothetical protein
MLSEDRGQRSADQVLWAESSVVTVNLPFNAHLVGEVSGRWSVGSRTDELPDYEPDEILVILTDCEGRGMTVLPLGCRRPPHVGANPVTTWYR